MKGKKDFHHRQKPVPNAVSCRFVSSMFRSELQKGEENLFVQFFWTINVGRSSAEICRRWDWKHLPALWRTTHRTSGLVTIGPEIA
jgi:hypothetical protein